MAVRPLDVLRRAGLVRPYEGPSLRFPWRLLFANALLAVLLWLSYLRSKRYYDRGPELEYLFAALALVFCAVMLVHGLWRVYERGRRSGFVLLGWGFGLVQKLPSLRYEKASSFAASSLVGVYLVDGGLVVVPQGKSPVKVSESLTVLIGERGRKRWVIVEEAGKRIEFRLWSTRQLQ